MIKGLYDGLLIAKMINRLELKKGCCYRKDNLV